jgi:ribonuclease HII
MTASLPARITEFLYETGIDEVGRGPGAGPVVAAAVIFPSGYSNPAIRDSKTLSEKQRLNLDLEIKQSAIAWGIGEATPEEIDTLNIANATFLAMERALVNLEKSGFFPDCLVVDGNTFKTERKVPLTLLVKGDQKLLSIAGASIIAKNYRDTMMKEIAKVYTGYGWETNMGYLSGAHIRAIKELGVTPLHRKSFLRKILDERDI